MIKTVSFAPPRSARAAKAASKSASNPATAQPARAASAATPATAQPARASSGSSPNSQAEEKTAAPRRRAAESRATTPTPATAEAAPKKPRVSRVAPATAATPPVEVAPQTKTPAKSDAAKAAAKAESTLENSNSEATIAPKIKRSRAPKDLALQYGAAPASEDLPRNVVQKPAPRKRLTREAKQARSQMLRPDDDVLQRLQQANAIEVKKPASRGRGWEFECGRCGRISRFQTPGAICQCGAIAVRE